jgi:hypothetical protein
LFCISFPLIICFFCVPLRSFLSVLEFKFNSYFAFPHFWLEHHWRDIICRNKYKLMHQNWYHISYMYTSRRPQF